MRPSRFAALCALVGAAGMLCVKYTFCAEPSPVTRIAPTDGKQAVSSEPPEGKYRVSVAVARERAKLMHNIYASTLKMLHHRYFHNDTSNIPARAMEDVFSEMATESKVKAKWIAVNTKAMGIDHEPQSEFEKQAAAEIASGKDDFELVEKGFYNRAAAIPLTSGCVSCHTRFFTTPPKSPRFAGLVISVPVNDE